MKTISRFFMAVVAGMFAFSCVTDTTEDLGVNLGEGQSTTIDISLEESRTHLGVKDLDGKEYPLYWSKGDKIAVNGKASDALGEAYHGQTQATFKFTGTLLNYPYNIVYPAPAEGVTAEKAGNYPVTFKTSQVYTEGSFAEGSVPMYGYVEDENDATTLNHLTGVLRIALYGTEVTLNAMTLSAESGKLSGNFDVNCTTGELTAHADASNTLSVSFGKGLTIATTEAVATPIYVAVPEGAYGKITITFYSSKGAMTKSFDTAEKPITAGSVREFAALEYVEGTTDTFIIYDEASLRDFASRVNAAEENFDTTYPNARVVADITLSDTEAWTSINGYTGSFDGGNHTISGLKAPLFGTTQASAIKNVKLTGVKIESAPLAITATTPLGLGALACGVNNENAEISNCSAEGTIIVESEAALTENLGLGGVIGAANAVTMSNITNKVNITLNCDTAYTYIGGCVGRYSSKTITNSTNLGNITITENCDFSTSLLFGGIAGQVGNCNNCTNGSLGADGKPTQLGKIEFNGSTKSLIMIGGIGPVTTSLANSTNYAPINIAGTKKGNNYYIAGVVVYNVKASCPSIDQCYNYGAIAVAIDNQATKDRDYVCGVVGGYYHDKTLTNCGNYGNIDVAAQSVGQKNCYIAGVSCNQNGGGNTATNFINTGNITVGYRADATDTHIGGLTGTASGAITNSYCHCTISAAGYTNVGMVTGSAYKNNKTNCHVGGSILKDTDTEAIPLNLNNYTAYIFGSGVTIEDPANDIEKAVVNTARCGWLSENIDSKVQYKTIAGVKIGSEADFLAWAATAANSSESVVLTADIDLSKVTDWSALGEGVTAWKSIENFKGIFDGGNFHINGLTAPLFGTTQAIEIKNVHLTEVDITSNLSPLGALACKVDNTAAIIQDCSADGTLTFTDSSLASNKQPCVAGMIGQIGSAAGDKNSVSGLVNSVDVNFKHSSACFLAGCVGVAYTSGIDNCTNLGTITYHEGYSAEYTLYVSGVCAQNFASDITNCTNGSWDEEKKEPTQEGKIVFNGTQASATHLLISGIICDIRYSDTTTSLKSCTNYGPIEVNGACTNTDAADVIGIGGIYAAPTWRSHITGEVTDCSNYGKITVSMQHTGTTPMYVGGIIGGYIRCSMRNIENHGEIHITDTAKIGGQAYIAGVQATNFITVGEQYASTFENIKNTGNITVDINNTGTEPFTNIEVSGIANSNSYINHSFNNARCYCNIKAIGIANVGMITGGARNATHPATNCHVGGSICTSTTAQGESERPKTIPLSAGNYFNYIYGSADWTGVANYDGCGYIESIDDATPDYATPQPEE